MYIWKFVAKTKVVKIAACLDDEQFSAVFSQAYFLLSFFFFFWLFPLPTFSAFVRPDVLFNISKQLLQKFFQRQWVNQKSLKRVGVIIPSNSIWTTVPVIGNKKTGIVVDYLWANYSWYRTEKRSFWAVEDW